MIGYDATPNRRITWAMKKKEKREKPCLPAHCAQFAYRTDMMAMWAMPGVSKIGLVVSTRISPGLV